MGQNGMPNEKMSKTEDSYESHNESLTSGSPSRESSARTSCSETSRPASSQESSYSKSRTRKSCKIVQVANLSPLATKEQMETLFGYLGNIKDIRIYQTKDETTTGLHCKVGFIKFSRSSTARVAQHLTNTVFIDRVIIVIPYLNPEIPDETEVMNLLATGSLFAGITDPKLPQHVSTHSEDSAYGRMIVTNDPCLAEKGLPPYPRLIATDMHERKIEEIRRTVVVCNLSSETSSNQALSFFSRAGEVKYLRFCDRENDSLKFALIEFTAQPSILEALQLDGQILDGNKVKVCHSTQAIVKPQAKTNEAIDKEIQDSVLEQQTLKIFSDGLNTYVSSSNKDSKERSRSRSRSYDRRAVRRERRRSHSESPTKRSRSRSRSRSRKHSRKAYRSRSPPSSSKRVYCRKRRRSGSEGRVRRLSIHKHQR